jgi:hypothetical protein
MTISRRTQHSIVNRSIRHLSCTEFPIVDSSSRPLYEYGAAASLSGSARDL